MKTLRFTTTCAIGAALALTLGASFEEAAAQQTDSTRRAETARPSATRRDRVQKESGGMSTMPATGSATAVPS